MTNVRITIIGDRLSMILTWSQKRPPVQACSVRPRWCWPILRRRLRTSSKNWRTRRRLRTRRSCRSCRPEFLRSTGWPAWSPSWLGTARRGLPAPDWTPWWTCFWTEKGFSQTTKIFSSYSVVLHPLSTLENGITRRKSFLLWK